MNGLESFFRFLLPETQNSVYGISCILSSTVAFIQLTWLLCIKWFVLCVMFSLFSCYVYYQDSQTYLLVSDGERYICLVWEWKHSSCLGSYDGWQGMLYSYMYRPSALCECTTWHIMLQKKAICATFHNRFSCESGFTWSSLLTILILIENIHWRLHMVAQTE